MAFVCPSQPEAEKRTKVLCKIKKLLQDVEEKLPVPVQQQCCCIPSCSDPEQKIKHPPVIEQFPDVVVCYKETSSKQHHRRKKDDSSANVKLPKNHTVRVKQSKSRELRAGCLYRGCDCEKKNGLQDDCPRTGCHGSPECLTKPKPICGPSEFGNGQHLEKKRDAFLKRIKKMHATPADCQNAHKIEQKIKYKCFPAMLVQPLVTPPVCYKECTCNN